MQKTWVCLLGWEDPLEKGMATHSSILAWRISWTEEPRVLQSMGLQRVAHNWLTNTHEQSEVFNWETLESPNVFLEFYKSIFIKEFVLYN